MADKNESTMTWKVDITQLKAAMQDAKRSISTANAEFKAATAGMDNWQKSTNGLEAKLKQLNSTLPQQKTILSQLEKQYELTAKELGENSTEAQKLKIQIENQKGTIAKTEAEINKYTGELAEMNSATGKLNATIEEQEAELGKLKTAYANAVVEFGESSQEAKALANQIDDLSGELVDNKKKLNDANTAADKLDKSMDGVDKTSKKTAKDVDKLDGGFTVLKGTMANLASSAIKACVNGLKSLGSSAVQTVSEIAQLGDDIDKESQKLQISAETYQKLAYAMDRSGSSIDVVSKGMKNISVALANTKNGVANASKNFDALGVSLKNADGSMKDSETVLLEVIDKLSSLEDETERSKLANDIFGKSYQELQPLLNSGAKGIHDLMQEAEDYGMVMGDDAVKASADYQDSLTKLKGTITGVKARLVQQFLPSIKMIIDGFSDMASGVDTSGKKIDKGVTNLWKTLTRMAKKNMPEISTTVLPALTKIYNIIKTVVKFVASNFGRIAPVVMTAVAAFASLNAVMAISNTVMAAKAAIAGLSTTVGVATKVQVGWNAAMAANPIGAVITAVVALTAAIVILATKQSDAAKAHDLEMSKLEEERQQIDANVDSWNDLKKSQQEAIDAGMTELSYYGSLKNELQGLVDKNGKVKKGYEERASFITGKLSEATGTEIEMVDGVIQNYTELMDTIDQVMEKKKAQIILDSQESLYKEAITKQGEALKQLNVIQDEYAAKKEELAWLENAYAINAEKLMTAKSLNDQLWYADEMERIQKQIDLKKEEVATVAATYGQQENLLSEYAYNIGVYEKNMELAHSGNYDQMTTATWNYVKEYKNADDAQRKILEDSIKAEETNLSLLKKLKKEGDTDVYDQQITQAEERLAQQKKELAKYVSATEEGVSGVTVEWKKGLDQQLSDLTDSQIEFKDAGDDQVQMYADGMKVGEPKATSEMAEIVTNTINEISVQYTNAKSAGEYLIDGVNAGVANQNKQNTVFNTIDAFGKKLLANLKKSLEESSPSKATDEMGQFLLVGVENGIVKRRRKTLSEVSSFGKSVIKTLNSELSTGADTSGIFGIKKSIGDNISALKSSISSQSNGINGTADQVDVEGNVTSARQIVMNYNQTINSPKAVDGMTLYQNTNDLLFTAKVRLGNA